MRGPLARIRVIEIAGVGPAPYASMMLADAGADVVRVDRREGSSATDPRRDVMNRNRRSIAIDLRHPDAAAVVLRLVEDADVLLEGFRPGVAERLGIGPAECLCRNPRLVYGRMTGWGQTGPLAASAGHDVNYIAVAGALASFARHGEAPVPPLNLVGDFGGGGMLLAFGVLCGLIDAARTGAGQVIDAAMVDGTASLMAMVCALRAQGMWNDEPGTNLLDTGAPFYDVYRTADGSFVSLGAIEDQFFSEFMALCGLDVRDLPSRADPQQWPELRSALAAHFATRTRDEWAATFEGTDACVAPVLSLEEAELHPQIRARGTYVRVEGVLQPAPAPRSKSPHRDIVPPRSPGADTDAILAAVRYDNEEIAALRGAGVVF